MDEIKNQNNVQVPKDVLVGLYRIMCNIPYSMSGMEVYPEALDGMKKAQQWVLKYGNENSIDNRGLQNINYKNMKAILEIPEREIKFELDDPTYNQFRIIGEKPSDISPMLTEKFPIGEPIILVTSNMPNDLKEEIVKMIERYCNH